MVLVPSLMKLTCPVVNSVAFVSTTSTAVVFPAPKRGGTTNSKFTVLPVEPRVTLLGKISPAEVNDVPPAVTDEVIPASVKNPVKLDVETVTMSCGPLLVA